MNHSLKTGQYKFPLKKAKYFFTKEFAEFQKQKVLDGGVGETHWNNVQSHVHVVHTCTARKLLDKAKLAKFQKYWLNYWCSKKGRHVTLNNVLPS